MTSSSSPLVAAAAPLSSPWRQFTRRFLRHRMALGATLFLLILCMAAILAPWLAPYDPQASDWMALASPPDASHWFGTDDLGRDIFSRILYGARLSLWVGLTSVGLGAIGGVLLGLIAGFHGGRVDTLIMRGADVLFAFPGMLLAIAIVAVLGPGLNNLIIAVAVFSVPVFARLVRAQALSLKTTTYVEAARSLGASTSTLMLRHLLPATLASVIVFFTMRIGVSILTAAGLSFIGLGPEPDVPEWGNMLASSRSLMMAGAWHVSVFPGAAIFVTVLAFNLLGDALRDTLDPKLKG
ncbi:ABC transporter permease subunit [Halotalea alkalilenta]|uniref:ABC transporter permease subunit n=1 Tax=Halotalea alkalilenta TaxID=376489 RepID=UPI000485E55A|nr:ABC transporter permease subunit [Halotalea alkalilenta]